MGSEIGIIGAGRIGQAMARTALRGRRPVVIANSRGPESLTSEVSALGDLDGRTSSEVGALAGVNLIQLSGANQP